MVKGLAKEPPTSAEELLARYAAGERDFARANLFKGELPGAYIPGVGLRHAGLEGATFYAAVLQGANLYKAELWGTDLGAATLIDANLRATDLTRATFSRATLTGAKLGGARLDSTILTSVDLTPFIDAEPPVEHHSPSIVDFASVALSIRHPGLKDFLVRSGMPELVAEYMVSCALAMETRVFSLLRSTFISYGGPDEPFARRLYEALHRNGVTTFFYPVHAKPGEKNRRVMMEGVENHDRVILVCSAASLGRPGVLAEVEYTLDREARDGGKAYLIPVAVDDCLEAHASTCPALLRTLRDRVYADFRGWKDDAKFTLGVRRLLETLRKDERPTSSAPG